MAKEIELKLRVVDTEVNVSEALESCFSTLGLQAELQTKSLLNIYYDTSDKHLNQHRMALRIRRKGDIFIQTLKTKGRSVEGLTERGEWEWQRPDVSLDLDVLKALDVWPEELDLSNLKAAFETNFLRYQAVLNWQGSEIELAVDQGEVLANEKSLPILELELELISGEVDALKTLAKTLGEYIKLEPFDISKAERGYSLL